MVFAVSTFRLFQWLSRLVGCLAFGRGEQGLWKKALLKQAEGSNRHRGRRIEKHIEGKRLARLPLKEFSLHEQGMQMLASCIDGYLKLPSSTSCLQLFTAIDFSLQNFFMRSLFMDLVETHVDTSNRQCVRQYLVLRLFSVFFFYFIMKRCMFTIRIFLYIRQFRFLRMFLKMVASRDIKLLPASFFALLVDNDINKASASLVRRGDVVCVYVLLLHILSPT